MTNNNCCFSKILLLIDKLQKNSEIRECFDNTCSRPYLGTAENIICYNTRPVTFYNCNNQLIEVDYTTTINGEVVSGTSSIFRIERVDGCCCVVSILIENPDVQSTNPYIRINQTVTINLECVCAIKCLADTIVDL